MRPLCFILMPFGKKTASNGRTVDFDAVYRELIEPAVRNAGLEPLRADEEMAGGVIHKAMFERLILCEYAVADLTTANANVFYELGLRHAVRPRATQLLFADGWGQLPFDVALLRALPYQLADDGTPAQAASDAALLTQKMQAASQTMSDSPVFQMVDGYPDIQRLKTDVFRDRVQYAEQIKRQLATARAQGLPALEAVESTLGDIALAEAALVVDLFLSYRSIKAWEKMIALVRRMSPPLAGTVMIQEQLGLALNRAKRSQEAEQVLCELIKHRGPSSETCGILGRVYKDRWKEAFDQGKTTLARGLLEKAIGAYVQGFESDWRDAYPGVNAVTLMELKEAVDPRQAKLLPIVTYAVEQRLASGNADYWDYATRLELAVLANDHATQQEMLSQALAHLREPWEAETTTQNLALIRQARQGRGESCGELDKVITELHQAGAGV